jgi:HEAT repeat protein
MAAVPPSEIPFHQLINALLDEETPFHPRYLYRLSDLDDQELGLLADSWSRISIRRRQALMEDMEELGEKDYLMNFEGAGRLGLRDSDSKVRALALHLLWEYEVFDLIPLFIDLMENDPEATVRAAAAQTLGKFVYFGELEELSQDVHQNLQARLLKTARSDSAAPVRLRAIESLGFSSLKEVEQLIEKTYASGEKEMVAASLFAMGRSANNRWEEHVISRFAHPFPKVRMEAARAAGELELDEAIEGLLELLDDDNDDVRAASIWSLSQIGGEGVRDALEEMQESTEDEEEADFIETALDNLSFTEEMELFSMFALPDIPDDLEDEEEDIFKLIEKELEEEEEED